MDDTARIAALEAENTKLRELLAEGWKLATVRQMLDQAPRGYMRWSEELRELGIVGPNA